MEIATAQPVSPLIIVRIDLKQAPRESEPWPPTMSRYNDANGCSAGRRPTAARGFGFVFLSRLLTSQLRTKLETSPRTRAYKNRWATLRRVFSKPWWAGRCSVMTTFSCRFGTTATHYEWRLLFTCRWSSSSKTSKLRTYVQHRRNWVAFRCHYLCLCDDVIRNARNCGVGALLVEPVGRQLEAVCVDD